MHLNYTQTHEGTHSHEGDLYVHLQQGFRAPLQDLCEFTMPMLHYAQHGALSGDRMTSKRLQG